MIIYNSLEEFNSVKHNLPKLSFVPTMGNLHEGHASLIDIAKKTDNEVVSTIYVNSLQFNDKNDFINYPKTLDMDIELLDKKGCNHLILPDPSILDNIKSIKAPIKSTKLCGAHRPGHFDGVLTILNRLFEIINPHTVEFGKKDYEVLEKCEPDAILIPKVNAPEDVLKYVPYLQNKKTMIWAMMETPHAIINANDIASCSKKLNCFVMGTNDLSKELDLNDVMRRTGLETSILTCLIAAKANKISLIDGVYNNIKDAEGFEEECKYGSGLGLDGKTLIHPSQIDTCNKVYSPSADEINDAEKIVLTYEEARKENPKVGVIIVDGKQIEELHVIRARKLLAFKNLLGK